MTSGCLLVKLDHFLLLSRCEGDHGTRKVCFPIGGDNRGWKEVAVVLIDMLSTKVKEASRQAAARKELGGAIHTGHAEQSLCTK